MVSILLSSAAIDNYTSNRTQYKKKFRPGIAIGKEIAGMLDGEPVPINDRIMTMRLPPQRNMYATFISVYAPTMTNTQETKEEFYSAYMRQSDV